MPAKRDTRSASSRPPSRPKKPPVATVDAIVQRVLGAILSHQLPPGTQLVEERLAAVFHVSRTKVRQALARLAYDGIVTVFPNRGAFVSSPTIDEARALFEVRRVKAVLKKPVKSVVERARVPRAWEALSPSVRDFKAATHIRELTFDEVAAARSPVKRGRTK